MKWFDLIPGDIVVRLHPSDYSCAWTILYKTGRDIGTMMITSDGLISYPLWQRMDDETVIHDNFLVVRDGDVIKNVRKTPFTW